MARMIPAQMEDDNGSFGERQVFNALKKLPDDYVVFHSLRWSRPRGRKLMETGECDFTILHPEKGILTIEVKGGGVEYSNGSWFYISSEGGGRDSMKDPMAQAVKSQHYFLDLLKSTVFKDVEKDEKGRDLYYCMVESAVWFPAVAKRDAMGVPPLEYHKENVLMESALASPQKFIDGIFDFYEYWEHTSLSPYYSNAIIEAFAPCYRAMPSLRSKRLEQEEIFVRLTNEQNSLLDYLEEQRVAAIQGAAGTGKTWLAIEKAKRLAEDGKVLFLCFNQFLRLFLQELKEEEPKKYQNIEFCNLPQLACKKLRVRTVEKEDILQFLEDYSSYDWEYKHIIVDEGQDFDDNQIDKLYDIALLQDGAFYVFFDKNQFVQGREFPQWLQNAECRLVLNINCRNTRAIADTSGKPIRVKPKVKNGSVKGDMPKFHVCDDQTAAMKKLSLLVDQYRNNGYLYSQICILTLKTEETSMLKGVDKIGKHIVKNTRGNGSVLFTTARKFKGLESDVIIIVDVDRNAFATEENKRLFYVGASRAKHYLDIVFAGDQQELEKISECVNPKQASDPIRNIAFSLNVKPVLK